MQPDQPFLLKRIMPWLSSPMQPNMRYLPQYRDRTRAHTPNGHQLYPGRYYAQTFAFTDATAAQPSVAALGTESINRTMAEDFLVWGFTGEILNPDDGSADFRVTLWHNVRLPDGTSFIRPLMSRPVVKGSVLGTGPNPHYLPQTYAVPAGDQIICEVKSLSTVTTANSKIWVVLHGTYLNPQQ